MSCLCQEGKVTKSNLQATAFSAKVSSAGTGVEYATCKIVNTKQKQSCEIER